MYETHVTVVGNLATAVDRTRFADGTAAARFRLASTERRYDRTTGGWVDGENLFLDVRCRRALADNVEASLVKGDRVVVTGRLYTRSYDHEGQRRSALTLEAHSVGADLSRCTAVLSRTRRSEPGEPDTGTTEPGSSQPESSGRESPGPDASGPGTHGSPSEAPAGTGARGSGADGGPSRLVGAAPGGEG